MQSNKWGNHAWEFYHTVTFNYPENPMQEDKDNYKTCFENLTKILPCSICRNSFTLFYKNLPINDYLDDRNGVTYWFYIIHNLVNLKLDNKLMHFKDVILKYENNRARCGNIDMKKNKDKLLECQKPIEWNNKMQKFMEDTFNKYHKITIKEIAKMIKNNIDRPEIQHIMVNLKKYNLGEDLF